MILHNSFMNSTITCSGHKEVDLDALNMVASGACECLCACSYANEKGHHRFVYKTEELTPFVHICAGLTFEEYVSLLTAGLSVIKLMQREGLAWDNLRLSKEYIFCAQVGYKFVYIPIACKSRVHIKDIVIKLVGIIHMKDERISHLVKDIKKEKDELKTVALLESFVRSFTVGGNTEAEGETTVLSQQIVGPEGETTVLSRQIVGPEGETTVLSQQIVEPEGETTVLSQQIVEPEGETSLLGLAYQNMRDENGGQKTVYSGITSERFTAFIQDESSEYETTVLTAQPQEVQHTVITGQNSAYSLSLIRNSTGEKVAVEITPFAIGKDRQSVDYVLDNDSVSRNHATIIFEDGNYFIIDNGSTNGTMIEGVRLQTAEKAELGNGYLISIGNETFQALLERR